MSYGPDSGKSCSAERRPSICANEAEGGMRGKYQGTVMERLFVVPFNHCLQRSERAVLGLCGQGSC